MSEFLRMSQAESHHVDTTACAWDTVKVQKQGREEQAQLECGHIVEYKRDICICDESVNEESLETKDEQSLPEDIELVLLSQSICLFVLTHEGNIGTAVDRVVQLEILGFQH